MCKYTATCSQESLQRSRLDNGVHNKIEGGGWHTFKGENVTLQTEGRKWYINELTS